MNEILKGLFEYEFLNETDAAGALKMLVTGDCTDSEAAAFLSVYILRKPSVQELQGFRRAMMELCRPVHLAQAGEAVDIVGTGGDGKNSFNISTLAALVTAAAGCPVIKHGNYGVSSVSGSSNVLEHLGYRFPAEPAQLQAQLDRANICFLHAPLFHPAMKKIAPVRKSLGVRSFFNLLGPLINPARPAACLLGTNSLETSRIYRYLLGNSQKRFAIVHSLDGYDEISLTGSFKLTTPEREMLITPQQMGLKTIKPEALDGGSSVQQAALIFSRILEGDGSPGQVDVVVANSGMAIHTARPGITLADSLALARETLVSGRAKRTFQQLLQHTL